MQQAIASYVCDGVADQVQIQLAIDSLPASGGAVILSQGTFYKNTVAPITLNSNVQLLMQPNTIIKLTANPGNNPVILSATSKSNILIRGGILDGSKALQTTIIDIEAMGISFTSVTDSRIDQVTVKDMGSSVALSGRGIYFNTSSRNQITNCLCTGSKRQNIVIYLNSNNNIIVNNVCKDSEDRNYVFHTANNNVLSNNVSVGAIGDGIQIRDSSFYNIITGNYCTGGSLAGINITSTCSDNIITNNYCYQNASHGISCNCSNNVIADNSCYDNTGSGISVDSSGTYNLIADNFLDNNGGVGGGLDNGITMLGDYNCVTGNGFRKGASQAYGIRIFAGGDNNFVSANNLVDAGTTAALSNAGAGNKIIGNNGWITENYGKSTGTGAQQTIAHGLNGTATYAILTDEDAGALPYQSAAADATNIYVTAVNLKKWQWHAVIR